MSKAAKKTILVLVAMVVAIALLLPLAPAQVAYAGTYGGQEYSELWYYDDLNIERAKQEIATWDLSKVTSPVIIACIDTGINAAHELFDGVLTKDANGNLLGYNSFDAVNGGVTDTMNIADDADADYHGTKVAGVMAMLIRELGLQDYIKIYPIKANTIKIVDGKKRATLPINSVANAINWATSDKVGASVLNMSFSSGDSEWTTDKDLQAALQNAVKTAVLVAASGNGNGKSTTTGIDSATTPYYPAASDYVLGVMGYGEDGKIYSSSNYGAAYDLAVPERGIYTSSGTNPNYTTFNGTSAGAPFVSVAAALLKLRYIVEGKLSVNNGIQAPSGFGFKSMLSLLNSMEIAKGSYRFKTLDMGLVLTQDFGDAGNYYDPTAIDVAHDGEYGEGDYADIIYQVANNIKPVNFTAKVLPLGKTNPALEETIEWYVKEIREDDENQKPDEEMTEQELTYKYFGEKKGNGLSFAFVAPHGGNYKIQARLKYGNKELSAGSDMHVEYMQYLPGEVRVTLNGHETDGVNDAPSSTEIYADGSVILGLTGIEYVDQTVEIKWFVNGKEVEGYSGTTFKFAPKKAGTYVISAKYGNRAEISGEYTFTVSAKSVMTNPVNIALVSVASVVVACGVVAIVVWQVLKKRKTAVDDSANE